MKRVLFRLVCIVLLLAGQQAGLTHALAHAHAHGKLPASAQEHRTMHGGGAGSHKAPDTRYSLCDFDAVFSQVLGGVHSAPPASLATDDAPQAPRAYAHFRISLTEVPFLSRGPPALL
ncbi:MAG TPA: hypothetical protein VIQ62_07870 [Burkholderiales bacterium]|jgi:hypothetical protein